MPRSRKGLRLQCQGVCGKTADVANLQDLLIYLMKGIAAANIKAKEIQQDEDAAVEFIVDGLFATITNANFDRDYFLAKIAQGLALRDKLKQKRSNYGIISTSAMTLWSGRLLPPRKWTKRPPKWALCPYPTKTYAPLRP